MQNCVDGGLGSTGIPKTRFAHFENAGGVTILQDKV